MTEQELLNKLNVELFDSFDFNENIEWEETTSVGKSR